MLGPFATASRRTPIHQCCRLRIDVHDDANYNNDNDNAWQRGPLWPHRMGPITSTFGKFRFSLMCCILCLSLTEKVLATARLIQLSSMERTLLDKSNASVAYRIRGKEYDLNNSTAHWSGMGLLGTQIISKFFSQVFARGRNYGADRAIR